MKVNNIGICMLAMLIDQQRVNDQSTRVTVLLFTPNPITYKTICTITW